MKELGLTKREFNRGIHDIKSKIEGNPDSETLKTFHAAGFLGNEWAPFLIPDPATAAASAGVAPLASPSPAPALHRRPPERLGTSRPVGEVRPGTMDDVTRMAIESPKRRSALTRGGRE